MRIKKCVISIFHVRTKFKDPYVNNYMITKTNLFITTICIKRYNNNNWHM